MRVVSYEKQLKTGMRSPGGVGLAVEKIGDMEPWEMKSKMDAGLKASSMVESMIEETNAVH